MNKNLLLVGGIALVCIGIFKPNVSNILPNIPTVSVSTPENFDVKKEAEDVIRIMKNSKSSSSKADAAQLRDLYINFAAMITLDNENSVITTTDEIRKANSISGHLLQILGLDLKNKYDNLAKECQDVIVASIGDDNVSLSPELRKKAADGFMALAWAFSETIK